MIEHMFGFATAVCVLALFMIPVMIIITIVEKLR